jgi:hypothetical protein
MRSWTRLDVLGIAAVAAIGILQLPVPFTGDQAFFCVGARQVSGGAVLYRDFWDVKQPGIFLFYLLGGKLFGFTDVGIHVFELLLLLVFSVVLLHALKRRFVHPEVASLLPVVAVGSYYAASSDWHMTQVEWLVGCPLFLSLWLTSEAHRFASGWRRAAWSAAGLLGGVVLLFKLMFLPMLVLVWSTSLLHAVRARREPLGAVAGTAVVPLAVGALIPLAAAVAWFVRDGTLGLVVETFFVLPPRILKVWGGDPLRLAKAMIWFGGLFAPLAVLGGWRAFRLLKTRPFANADSPLEMNLVLWCISGLAVILLQRQSWWQYHFLLLTVPLAILMLLELDERWGRWKNTGKVPAAAVAALVLLFVPMTLKLCKKTLSLALHRGAVGEGSRLAYRQAVSVKYRIAVEETRFLTVGDSRPGAIFVAGNPLFYFVSGRDQAVGLNGWAMELFVPEQWVELTGQLRGAKPPYIYLDEDSNAMMRHSSRLMTDLIETDYAVLSRTPSGGVWHVRRSPP